jgi:hypothetical protein
MLSLDLMGWFVALDLARMCFMVVFTQRVLLGSPSLRWSKTFADRPPGLVTHLVR